MRISFVIAVLGMTIGCGQPGAPDAQRGGSEEPRDVASRDIALPVDAAPASAAGESSATIKPWTAAQQQELLSERLEGGMGGSFRDFSNVFLVSSRLNLGPGVGLVTSTAEIGDAPLSSPFPESYKPTLREFLDAIALQTSSQWSYDPSSKYFKSEVPHEAPVEDVAIFEFQKANCKKPYAITLAKGWKTVDNGNWVMHVPPAFPVGMDIYEMGTYSAPDKESESDFADTIRSAVALQWAGRAKEHVELADLKAAKVGAFDALYFETMIPTQLKKDMKWRQWVFMVDNRCYFIVSTILPDLERKILPDIEAMLASFRIATD